MSIKVKVIELVSTEEFTDDCHYYLFERKRSVNVWMQAKVKSLFNRSHKKGSLPLITIEKGEMNMSTTTPTTDLNSIPNSIKIYWELWQVTATCLLSCSAVAFNQGQDHSDWNQNVVSTIMLQATSVRKSERMLSFQCFLDVCCFFTWSVQQLLFPTRKNLTLKLCMNVQVELV